MESSLGTVIGRAFRSKEPTHLPGCVETWLGSRVIATHIGNC